MLNPRWWDIAVGVGSVVITVALFLGFGSEETVRMAVACGAIVLFAIGYVAIARPAIGCPPAGWRFPAFLAVAAVALGFGSGAVPFVAMLQALAYPLVWVIGDTRRRGIAGTVVIAASVSLGIFLGHERTLDAAISGIMTGLFSAVFATALGLWITSIAEYGEERGRLVAELTAAQAALEALSRDRGAAAERERLARDIHDTLAQTLAGLVIFAERAGRQSRDGQTDAAAATISTVEQVARDALAEARALVARTAAVPSEPAFEAAVERLVERFRAHGAGEISLDAEAVVGRLDRESQVVMLRCLQEALSNVAKHAAASRVAVRVAVDADGSAALAVTDDGHGFDPGESGTGFGLDGMRERVALVGGTLEVSSAPGQGTTLRVALPAAPERAAHERQSDAQGVVHDAQGGAA